MAGLEEQQRRRARGVFTVTAIPLVAVAVASAAAGSILAGTVDRDPYCDPALPIKIRLSPTDRTTTVDAAGAFRFADVADGDYLVTAEPECQPSEYTTDTVYVRGTDAFSRLFWMVCPQQIVVRIAADHKTADIHGRCYYIHSGAPANVYVDGELVGTVMGDTPGNYQTTIDISALAVGRHVMLVATPSRTIGSAQFWLDPAFCAGDCNTDERVDVTELVFGVRRALDLQTGGCDRLDVDGSGTIEIFELIEATDALLNGCPYAMSR